MAPLEDMTNRPRDQHVPRGSSRHLHRTSWAHLDLGFSLYNSGNTMSRGATDAEYQTMYNHYPGTFKLFVGAMGICLYVDPLPPRPHPVTIADVPLYITDDPDHRGFDALRGRLFGGPDILNDIDLRHKFEVPRGVLDRIRRYCERHGVLLSSVASYFGDHLVCGLEEPYSGTLPRRIGKKSCTWKVDDGMIALADDLSPLIARFQQVSLGGTVSRRKIEPTTGRNDEANYLPNLKPGIMVRSDPRPKRSPPQGPTFCTLGVGVKERSSGQKYVTTAAHAFEGTGGYVRHPVAAGGSSVIGQIEKVVGRTDIALMKLNRPYTHSNQIFMHGNEVLRMTRIVPDTMNNLFDVEFNSPFDGQVAGECTGIVYKNTRLPSGIQSGPQWWAGCDFINTSVKIGSPAPSNGACGSPVLHARDGDLAGFVWLLNPVTGWANCTAAYNMVPQYDLV